MSLNKVMIIGRLGQDPELRCATTGMAICRFSVATDESYQDRDGQRQEKTEWHRVVTFQKQAENCSNYLHKGSLVFVEGSLSTNKWTDQQGQTRYTTEIKAQRVQFLDRKGDNQGGADQQQGAPRQQPAARGNAPRQQRRPVDDDLGQAFPSGGSNFNDLPFN